MSRVWILIFIWYIISFVDSSPVSTVNLKENENEINNQQKDIADLLAVITISRHGDRAPMASFPNDKYATKDYWPMGLGQLTQNGIKRMYETGKWFRKHYNGFLGEIYDPDELFAVSTDTDRTLMSAYASLAGLYPPKEFQIWNNDLLWQPIPVHIADFLSLVERQGCEKFFKLLADAKNERYRAFEDSNRKLFDYIANSTGWPHVSVDEVEFLVDVFASYRENNPSWIPEWERQLDTNLTQYLAGVVYELPTHTDELAKFRIGTFYDHVFKLFESFAKPSDHKPKPKFTLIAAHESTLVAILNTMGAYNFQHIGYADTVIFELKQTKENEFYVNIFYKREDHLEDIHVKNCNLNCGLDEFKKNLANVTINVKQWHQGCENSEGYTVNKGIVIKR